MLSCFWSGLYVRWEVDTRIRWGELLVQCGRSYTLLFPRFFVLSLPKWRWAYALLARALNTIIYLILYYIYRYHPLFFEWLALYNQIHLRQVPGLGTYSSLFFLSCSSLNLPSRNPIFSICFNRFSDRLSRLKARAICPTIMRLNGLNGTNGITGINDINADNFDSIISRHSEPLSSTHSLLVYKTFEKLQRILRNGKVKIDGESLDIPTVVAVSKYRTSVSPLFSPKK